MKMGTHEATFVEDCYFKGCSHPTDAFGGGHYVLRYSELVDNASVGGHGPGFDDSHRGTRCTEIYENIIQKTDKVSYDYRWVGMSVRAGGGVVYNNHFVYCRYAMLFTIDNFDSYVDDDHDGIPDYPALDQVQEKWIWDNALDSTPQLVLYNNDLAALLIQEDRDYFLRAPTVELDGFTYTPYTYPHPLRGGQFVVTNDKSQRSGLNDKQFMVYPNPSFGEIVIKSETGGEVCLNIFSMTGQLLFTKKYDQHDAIHDRIDLTEFPTGVYAISLISNGAILTKKIILTR
jgi:hypothetical protein